MRVKILFFLALSGLLAACGGDNEELSNLTTPPPAAPAPPPILQPAPQQPVQAQQIPQGPAPGSPEEFMVAVGDRVFFATDQSTLPPEARATLERQAVWLQTYPNYALSIEGHADERGTREYNLALGARRASAIKNYLVALGIGPGRLSTISYGKERPEAPGSIDESWAQNRRGVSVISSG